MANLMFELEDKATKGKLLIFEDRIELTKKDVNTFFNNVTTKTIPINSLTSVQLKAPGAVLGGFLQFSIAGGIERKGAGSIDAVKDENSFLIRKETYETAKKIKEYLDDKIANKNSGGTTVVQQTSAADELKKFKELLDSGVITQEEFDAKKKQLLGL